MTFPMTDLLIRGAAALCPALGLIAVLHTAAFVGDAGPRLDRKRRDVDALLSAGKRFERYSAALAACESLRPASPAPIISQVNELLGEYRAQDIRETKREIDSGWTVRKADIVLDEIPVARALDFVSRVENLRPPWRLTQCVIKSSSTTPGSGQVTLTLEALEKR